MTHITLLPAEALSHEALQHFFSECLRIGAETNLLPTKMYETGNSKKAALSKPVKLDDEDDRTRITQKFIPLRKFPDTIIASLWADEINDDLGLDRDTVLRISSNRFGYRFIHSLSLQFPSLPAFMDYFDDFIAAVRFQSSFDIVARGNSEPSGATVNISIRDREWHSKSEDKLNFEKIYSLVHLKQ